MKFTLLLLLTFCSVVSIHGENGFDAVFDSILQKFNDEIKSKNMCQEKLQDVSTTVKYKAWIFTVYVHIKAADGNVKDFCSFKRSGDVQLTQSDSSVTLSLGIDMDNLEINYGDVDAKAPLFYKNFGALKVLVKEHTVQAQVTLSMPSANSCNLSLDYVDVSSLGGIEVYLKGKENSNFEKMANGDITSIKQMANSILTSKIEAILNSENVCQEILEAGITLS